MPILERRIAPGRLLWELDAPEARNAIAPEDLDFVERRCATLGDEVVVVTGAAEGPFSSGFDLRRLGGAPRPDLPLLRATAAMERSKALFVASVRRYAIGAAVELCAACDVVCAASDAFFAIPAARLGVLYHREGMARLERRFGRQALRAMMLLGRRVEASRIPPPGALDVVVEPDELDAAVEAVVADLLAAPAEVRGPVAAFLRGDDRGASSDPAAWSRLRGRLYAALRARPATLPRP